MKKITLILLLALLSQIITAQTQSCFDGVLDAAKTDYYNKNYFLALQKLNAIENACVNLETISKSQKLVLDQWRDSIKNKLELMVEEINTEKSRVQTAVFEKAAAENNRKDYFGSWSFKDIESLDLSNSNLVYLPAEVSNCPMLKKINLIGNPNLDLDSVFAVLETLPLVTDIKISIDSLAQIPEKYRRWTTGIKLNTDSCTVFPLEILELENLNYLDVSGELFNPNYFTVLPEELFQKANLKHLILEYCKINELPAAIGNLVNLVELKLSGNNLKTLPLEIYKLQNIKVLGIENNFFETLPFDVCKLLNLEVLSCYNNFLKLLPADIKALKNLTALYLWNNSLAKIPDEICSLAKLTDLRIYSNIISEINPKIVCINSLNYLDLSYNKIKVIPVEIGKLTKIENLYLNNNQITDFPPEIGQITELKTLDLSNNLIKNIPVEIQKLTQLETLDLDSNQIASLPNEITKLQNLSELNINNNQITTLPENISEMKELKYIYIENTNIPAEEKAQIEENYIGISSSFEDKNTSTITNLPEIVYVKGGTFSMGSEDGEEDEKPVHEVTLTDYYIGKYEVTNLQFAEFIFDYGQATTKQTSDYPDKTMIYTNRWSFLSINSDKIEKPNQFITDGYENFPVIMVTWYGAYEYCKWLTQKTGKNYSLPTEAQWEYAAGGGSNYRNKWSGTQTESKLVNYAWISINSGEIIHEVGSKTANSIGIYDMNGNVWEWCMDWYKSDYYTSEAVTNPVNNEVELYRVDRGGSWYVNSHLCRVTYRDGINPSNCTDGLGFRVVLYP